jgi:hypothetical protein
MALTHELDNSEERRRALHRVDNQWQVSRCPWVGALSAIAFLIACTPRSEGQLSRPTVMGWRAYDVFVTRHSDTYHPRTYGGLLATDGKQQRIAFYWLDPAAECEQTDALAFSDFLFQAGIVSYWHHNPGLGTVLRRSGRKIADGQHA